MDGKALRDEALELTARFFRDHGGDVPDPNSDEWEEEYRRQFEVAKRRQGSPQTTSAALVEETRVAWPSLHGPDGEKRWAAAIRDERLTAIHNKELRAWVAGAWTQAKPWIDTRDLPAAQFLRRVELQFAEYRRRAEAEAAQGEAQRQAEAAAAHQMQRRLADAHITVQGLIELIDVSPRLAPAPVKAKLAELAIDGRSLRVFESSKPSVLMVLEKSQDGRSEYGIERDEGLAADLKLFGQAQLR